MKEGGSVRAISVRHHEMRASSITASFSLSSSIPLLREGKWQQSESAGMENRDFTADFWEGKTMGKRVKDEKWNGRSGSRSHTGSLDAFSWLIPAIWSKGAGSNFSVAPASTGKENVFFLCLHLGDRMSQNLRLVHLAWEWKDEYRVKPVDTGYLEKKVCRCSPPGVG